jgi:CubicO group peptidase (beta-lactamase class C family)
MHELDRYLTSLLTTPGAPLSGLAVVVYRQGQICYEGYFGQRRIDPPEPARSLPVTPTTRFRVASLSKTVTALATMQLVEQSQLDLDADLSTVLGWPLYNPHWPAIPITARMLLTHTSSLRDGESYLFPPTTTLASVLAADRPGAASSAHVATPHPELDLAPGRFFTYCNLGFGLLGTVVEKVSGERFDRYVTHRLLAGLGVEASFNVATLSADALSQLAPLYRRRQAGIWNPEGPWVAQIDDLASTPPFPAPHELEQYHPGSNGTLFSPQGGLRISARDLVEVMKVFLNAGQGRHRPVLQPATVAQILQVEWRFDPTLRNGDPYGGLMRAWGLGLHHFTGSPADAHGRSDRLAGNHPRPAWGHLGDAHGLLGGMLFDPSHNTGMIYLIGGVGCDPETYRGKDSAFYGWEEALQRAILAFFPL